MKGLNSILIIFLLFSITIAGQNNYDKKIQESKERIDSIISKEKKLLAEKIKAINKMIDEKEISEYTARKMKRDLSLQTRDNIQNQITKERNKITALLKEKRAMKRRLLEEKFSKQDSIYKRSDMYFEKELEMAMQKLDSLFFTETEPSTEALADAEDIKYQNTIEDSIQDINILGLVKIRQKIGRENSTQINIFPAPRRARRSISGLHIALGFHTLNSAGHFGSNKFKVWGSKSFEIGAGRSTRIFKNSELLRINYGYSFMFNKLKMKGSEYFVNTDGKTSIERYPHEAYKSKFRATYLIFPISLELNLGGFYDCHEREYNRGFRLGVGGYAGGLLAGKQKVKYYDENGKKRKDVSYNTLSTNDWVYGLSAHIGYRNKVIYAKYSLVPLFRNNLIDEFPLSFGFRWGL